MNYSGVFLLQVLWIFTRFHISHGKIIYHFHRFLLFWCSDAALFHYQYSFINNCIKQCHSVFLAELL